MRLPYENICLTYCRGRCPHRPAILFNPRDSSLPLRVTVTYIADVCHSEASAEGSSCLPCLKGTPDRGMSRSDKGCAVCGEQVARKRQRDFLSEAYRLTVILINHRDSSHPLRVTNPLFICIFTKKSLEKFLFADIINQYGQNSPFY